jgi:nicotinamide mononucleotide (NMN) deamidase PncC
LLDPNGGTKNKPVGLVYIAVKKSNKILITKNIFKQKNRNSIQKATVKRSLKIIDSLI